MAKGNVGNLLQHFVALRVAERLASFWNQPNEPIEYVDCYSMGPWEDCESSNTPQHQMFTERLQAIARSGNDSVAATFNRAWQLCYGDALPDDITVRRYPNTAVLLRCALPDQAWNMRLHELKDAEREALASWAARQTNGTFSVGEKWRESDMIRQNPVPVDRPVLVMLDPYQIVPADSPKANDNGYLRPGNLRSLFGSLALNMARPSERPRTAPCVVLLFSYSDQIENRPHRVVCDSLLSPDWNIERVSTGLLPDIGRQKVHQGWVASNGIDVPLLGMDAQEAWNDWFTVHD